MFRKNYHEHDEFAVRLVADENISVFSTCYWWKAVWRYMNLRWRYPKMTVEFRHYQYW